MKFLYFETDADGTNGVCIPASAVVGVDSAAATELDLYFNDLGDANTSDGHVRLNVTSGKAREVAEAIAKAIYQGSNQFITVADDTNSEYLHEDITSCGAITLAA